MRTTLEQLRVDCTLVAARLDERGERIDEVPVARFSLAPGDFDSLAREVDGVWPNVVEEAEPAEEM
jgi:hypothetical protein